MNFNPFVEALIRHALTGLGMWMARKGYVDESVLDGAIGASVTLISVGWSMVDKKREAARQASAAGMGAAERRHPVT